MKRDIRKLVLVTIITVIVPFMLAACATTSPSAPQGVRGQYAGIGQGMTLMAPFGFKPNSTASCTDTPQGPVCPSVIQTSSGEGVYSFGKDGTGSLTSLISIITESFRGPSGIVPASAGIQKVSIKFHYTITDGDKITITADPYSVEFISGPSAKKIYNMKGWVRNGIIALGGKMIMLTGSVANVVSFTQTYADIPPATQIISNGTNILIWQHD